MRVREIIGVDFSGAAEAGRFIWVARCEPMRDVVVMPTHREPGSARPRKLRRLRVTSLAIAEDLAGSSKREVVLPWLRDAILASRGALWGIDAPFGLPVELGWRGWPAQLRAVARWRDGATAFGVDCCRRSMKAVGALHVRRMTDRETRTPFDCHHYRIIHQTFWAMHTLVPPLRDDPTTCVMPFEVEGLETAKRVVAEACPGSTLRRLALPHNRYKQTKPGRVAAKLVRTRKAILEGIEPLVEIDDAARRAILRNPGGDALDAVLAAVGAWFAWSSLDAKAVAAHPRYTREGLVFC